VLKSLNDTHQTNTDALVPIEVDHVPIEVDPISKFPIVSAKKCRIDPSETNGISDLDETSQIGSQNFASYFLTDKVNTFSPPC